ncbi:MAG: hypothetical protein ACK5TH_17670 [Prosthecobacter sp.]
MKTRFLLLLLGLLQAGVSFAGVTVSSVAPVKTTNYSGLLVEADALTGHVPNQSLVTGEWGLSFTWDGLDTVGYTFESTMWFEDEAGVKVPFIKDGGGPVVTEVVEEYQVSLDAVTTTDQHTFGLAFRPQTKLLPNKRYTMKAKWRAKRAGENYGTIFILVTPHSSAPNTQLYFHFQNTTSGDAALNASTHVVLDSWTRRWMIESSTTQNTFSASVTVSTLRFDDFDVAATSATISNLVRIQLKHAVSGAVVYTSPGQLFSQSVMSHAGGLGADATVASASATMNLQFSVPPGVLDASEEYVPVLQVSHNELPAGPTDTSDGERAFAAQRLLSLTGKIFFGSIVTYGNEMSNDPVADLYPAALPLPTSTLAVVPGQGVIPTAPGATFGGTPLAVEILSNGDAVYGDGTEIPVTAAGTVVHQGVTFNRSGVVLKMSGAKAASVTVRLPRGMGYTYTAGTRVMKNKITAADMTLESNLLPSGMAAFVLSGTTYVTLERLPLVFGSGGISFSTATGKFTFVPTAVVYDDALELLTLESYGLNNLLQWPAGVPLHAGNSQVFRTATVSGQDTVQVSVAEDGAAFIEALKLGFNAGAWWTHFPTYWLVSTSGAGTADSVFEIVNDVVDQDSLLGGVQGIAAYYTPDTKPETGKKECPSGVPAVGVRFFALTNQDQEMQFLADGSLDADMTAAADNAPLLSFAWGTFQSTPTQLFAHRISRTNGNGMVGKAMLPGHFLTWRGAAVDGLETQNRTAAVHLSGRGFGSGGTQVEHPHQAAYSSGAADYAGFNLRKSELTSCEGVCRIGGSGAENYSLLDATKLYVRSGGISGMIQSPDDLGPLLINGFDFSLDGIKLAFLDNCVAGSALDGGVTVGGASPAHPCEFTVDFLGLKLWSNGALNKGEVDPNQSPKLLDYWKTSIAVLSMDFVQPSPCDGPGAETFLSLGVDTALPGLTDKTLQGILGFNHNGSLVTKAQQTAEQFAQTQLDSRLRVPGNIKLKGPGSASYSMSPLCGVYLNHWPGNGVEPTLGYASIAGSVDVPFFENLKVHAHASSNSESSANAIVHVMQPPPEAGPFTQAEFDPGNLGVPVVSGSPLNLTTYRTAATYRVHAMKNWLGMVDFDFPMKWNVSQRCFEMGPLDLEEDHLVLLKVKSRARTITPTTADLKFSAELGVSLPSIDASALIGQALEGVGVSSPLGAIQSVVPGFGAVMSDLASFEQLLADTPENLVRQPLIEAVAAARLTLPSNANATQVQSALLGHLNDFFNDAAQATDTALSWKQPVMVRLNKVDSISSSLKSMIGNTATVLAVANALATAISGSPSPAVPEEVEETLGTAYGALTLLQSGIADVRSGINAISLSPDWAPVLTTGLADLPDAAAPLAQTDAQIADAILNRFLGSASAAQISEEMRVHVSDTRDRLRSAVDSIFAGINEMLQSASGDVPFLSPKDAEGSSLADLADMQFGKIDGQARINGDTLHELRLDADLKLALGMDLDFHGYLLYRDLSSDTPSNACRTSAGVAAELTLGASTKFDFGAPPAPTELEVEAKFAFGSSGMVNGLAGRFGVAGDGFKLGVLTIKQAELGFGFGGNDAYLYGKGAGKSDWADIEAAVFLGRACNPSDVMSRVDSEVSALLNRPEVNSVFSGGSQPVYGLYAFGYGSISINALIGIPPSPMLNLKAGCGMGGFYFTRHLDVPGDDYAVALGLRQDFGVSGEVLCLADISARLSMIGATTFNTDNPLNVLPLLSDPLGHPIVGTGKADVSLEVGVSPFDFTLHKTLRMNFSYQPGPSLDFDLDL